MTPNRKNPFVPIVIAVSLVLGILIGTFLANRFAGNRLNIINNSTNKLNDLLHIIDAQYVDTVNIQDLVEQAMPQILSELDPHSSYISVKDAQTANDDLRGSFSGIGVQFTIRRDTVYVNNIIKGGPSERVGLLAGDRIIAINGEKYVGDKVTNEETMHRLKGPKDSDVTLTILRHGQKKNFTVTRGDIPVKSIDATYMLTPQLGYIRVKSFGETTYAEMLTSLAQLQQNNFKGLVVDLRGNGGGYLASAIQLVNEFLPADRLIVYTQGRKSPRQDYKSDGRGSYQSLPIIVLTDETTASAAEIFSGAIQDNDRGIIVGRRTFGKGLVQESIDFSDGSILRLTVARYYTPSGRCIQKPYSLGHSEDYEMDILTRYNHGEFFNEDSIRQTGQKYKTSIGRIVYGGGGIMPDYFVAEDTTLYTSYFLECANRGLLVEFAFNYTDEHRTELSKLGAASDIVKHLQRQHLLEQFVQFADSKGVKRRNNMIYTSRRLFEQTLYGNIVYNMLDMQEYLEYLNENDSTILRAIQLFNAKLTQPQKAQPPKHTQAKQTTNHRDTQYFPTRNVLLQHGKQTCASPTRNFSVPHTNL